MGVLGGGAGWEPYSYRVAAGQEMVRENNSLRSGKSQGTFILSLEKSTF